MLSFTPILISAALVTFTTAASTSSPSSLAVSVSSASDPSVPAFKIDARSTNTPSVPAIFSDLMNQIQQYTEELTFVTPSNISASLVEKSVSSIDASVATAISQLQTLNSQSPSVILAPVEGDTQLSIPQVSSMVSDDINVILGAAGNVVNAAASAGINVDSYFDDLSKTLFQLLKLLEDLGILKSDDIIQLLSNPIVKQLLRLFGLGF